MGIRDRPMTPRSPWQNGHVERLIGSIRRECPDHVVVLGERHLRHRWRITPPTTTGCARILRSTRIPLSIDLRRQSGVSHQSLGSAVSIGTTFGWHNRQARVPRRHRKRQHLGHRPRVNPKAPRRLPLAHTFNLNRKTHPSVKLHALHPPVPVAFRQRPSAAGFLIRRCRATRPLQ